jgi:hypothetical protein
VAPAQRSDRTLMARAIEVLVSTDVHEKAARVLQEDADHPIRRLLASVVFGNAEAQAPSVPNEELDKAVSHLQRGLLRYLAARGEAGHTVRVSGPDLSALSVIAEANGFQIDQSHDEIRVIWKE